MISIVVNSLGRGGAERSVLILLEELLDRCVDAELVLLRDTAKCYDLPPRLDNHVLALRAPNYVCAGWALLRHLREREPTVVYAMMPQASFIAVAAGALAGVRVVTSERTTPKLFYRNPIKRLIALVPHSLASRTVFISRYALDNGLPPGRLAARIRARSIVLHNPVPVQISPDQAGRERRIRARLIAQALASDASPPMRILLATRLVPGKGVAEFLNEVSPWLRHANAKVTIAGVGPLEASVQALALSLGLGEKVHMVGFLDSMDEAYRAADVVVLPSESEGFGRVGFEAYQHGCFVVGRPKNCFFEEVAPGADAWAAVGTFAELPSILTELVSRAADEHEDIARMQSSLSRGTHASRFLNIVRGGE